MEYNSCFKIYKYNQHLDFLQFFDIFHVMNFMPQEVVSCILLSYQHTGISIECYEYLLCARYTAMHILSPKTSFSPRKRYEKA